MGPSLFWPLSCVTSAKGAPFPGEPAITQTVNKGSSRSHFQKIAPNWFVAKNGKYGQIMKLILHLIANDNFLKTRGCSISCWFFHFTDFGLMLPHCEKLWSVGMFSCILFWSMTIDQYAISRISLYCILPIIKFRFHKTCVFSHLISLIPDSSFLPYPGYLPPSPHPNASLISWLAGLVAGSIWDCLIWEYLIWDLGIPVWSGLVAALHWLMREAAGGGWGATKPPPPPSSHSPVLPCYFFPASPPPSHTSYPSRFNPIYSLFRPRFD